MCEQKTSYRKDFVPPSNGMTALDAATLSPSNSRDISNEGIHSKHTIQEVNCGIFHNEDCSNVDACRRVQYQTDVNQAEMLSRCMTGSAENALRNSKRCHQNAPIYETTFVLRQSYVQNSENSENQCPEYSGRNEVAQNSENEENQCPEYSGRNEVAASHPQNQLAQYYRVDPVMLHSNGGTHSQHGQDVASYDSDVMVLQEDGSVAHQLMTVDGIKSMPLTQENGVFSAGEAFEHTTPDGRGRRLLHCAQGVGESLRGT
jgi:hypothetical protein